MYPNALSSFAEWKCMPILERDWPWLPKQARDVIDKLAEEVRQVRDMIRVERNDHHFMQDEDRAIDMKVQTELHM